MCVRLRSTKMKPGDVFTFITSSGKGSGIWGLQGGKYYNLRYESMDSYWRGMGLNRAIITANSFWEIDMEFVRPDDKPFSIAVLFNHWAEFSVVTVPASDNVRPFHSRMPACLSDDHINSFLDGSNMILLSSSYIQLRDNSLTAA